MPWELTRSVEHACRVLDWQENMISDEQPPQWMWHLDQELNDWFAMIDAQRKDKYDNPSSDDREQGPMMSNEFNWDKD